jgi:hypothetical protein
MALAAIYARPRHVASGAKFQLYFIIIYYLLGHVNLALSRYYKNKLAAYNLIFKSKNYPLALIHVYIAPYLCL